MRQVRSTLRCIAAAGLAMLPAAAGAFNNSSTNVQVNSNSSGSTSSYSSTNVQINSSSSQTVNGSTTSQSSSESHSSVTQNGSSNSHVTVSHSATGSNGTQHSTVTFEFKDGRLVRLTSDPARPELGQQVQVINDAGGIEVKLGSGSQSQTFRVRRSGGTLIFEPTGSGLSFSSRLPLRLDPTAGNLGIVTSKGLVNVTMPPGQAADRLRASGLFDAVTGLELTSRDLDGKTAAVLVARGSRRAKLFGLFPVQAPVTAEFNLDSGRTQPLSQAWYLRRLGFLFAT